LRLRSVLRVAVSHDEKYTPIYTVRSVDGKDFGDAAGFAEFTRGEFKGGRILYIWSHILSDPQLGPPVVGQVLRWVIAEARK